MPDRWRAYLIYLLQTLLKRLDEKSYVPEVHEVEQYMFRYLRCSDCMEAGKCVRSDCGCKMPERAHVRTDFCPTLRWPPFKEKAAWEKFKKDNSLKFILESKLND